MIEYQRAYKGGPLLPKSQWRVVERCERNKGSLRAAAKGRTVCVNSKGLFTKCSNRGAKKLGKKKKR